MAYKRKTIDTWQIWINYGYGWEHETTELTYAAYKENKKAYRENCPQYPLKTIRKREKHDMV